MSFTVIAQYNSFVENNFIKKDPKQLKVLERINDLWINKEKRKFFFKNNFKQGIYVSCLSKELLKPQTKQLSTAPKSPVPQNVRSCYNHSDFSYRLKIQKDSI